MKDLPFCATIFCMKQKASDFDYKLSRQRSIFISHVLTIGIFAIIFITLVLNILIFPVHVRSDTMEKDIPRDSAVFVCPFLRTPRRGDVVYLDRTDGVKLSVMKNVVNSVVGFFTAQRFFPFGYTHNMSGKPVLRRVLALPGDEIYMKDYVLYVKPEGKELFLTEFELVPKPYNTQIYSVPAEWDGIGSFGNMPNTILKADQYFVLADNRIEGADSRVWGSISSSRIKGRAVLEYFPFSKFNIF